MNEPLALCHVCGHTVAVGAPCGVCDLWERTQQATEAHMKAWIADRYRAQHPHLRALDVDA